MHCVRKINEDLCWVGCSDRRLALFENMYPIPEGISYNSYILTDDKTVLFDTVDKSVSSRFLENVSYALQGRKLDYIVINHIEPDHCASLKEIMMIYPEIKIIGNAKTINMLKQFYDMDFDNYAVVVKEGDTFSCGKHTLRFFLAPMVHWPEVMVTYDETSKVLFSADAFGTFGALNGNIFAHEVDFEHKWLDSARRYYANIVGKYGRQVQAILEKASKLDIETICPLHGPIWQEDIEWYINKYKIWGDFEPEEKAVMIAYGSVYGNTENAVDILALKLAEKGIKNIAVYDVSTTHISTIISESFRCSHLIFASSTYNGGIFTNMENLLIDLKHHDLQKRTVGLIENGSWGPVALRQMKEILDGLKEINFLGKNVTIKSSLKEDQNNDIDILAGLIADSINE